MQNFDQEKSIIDNYVDAKESGANGDHLILELTRDHFLPQGRFEEARSWKNAIKEGSVKKEVDALIKDEMKSQKSTSIFRMPQNTEWHDSDVSVPAVKSEDQQYHYDRTMAYSNATQQMFDELDDVTECRNEWITFVARNAYEGGLGEKGAELNVLAMSISDYIEYILIPDDYFGFEEVVEAVSFTTVEQAFTKDSEDIEYLRKNAAAVLPDEFLMHFYCLTERGGKTQLVVVSRNYIVFIPVKKTGWSPAPFEILHVSNLATISVGTEQHTQYQGLVSTSEVNWTLTFFTTNYTQTTKFLYLGQNEREMNQNRPAHGKTLELLSQFFELEQGDSFETSDGYTTSFGFWV
jgi:hypothetical protein